jgi:dolichol-phosphate mannosyltransferase
MTSQQNFSIIIPTFKEADNIPELVKRIANVDFGSKLFEVILVDDNSKDGIQTLVANLQIQYPWLKLLIRYEKKGLSASVIAGFQEAQYPLLIVMDADLSHPPEKIPVMLNLLCTANLDMVIGSRYIQGGTTDKSWHLGRKIISKMAAFLARCLIIADINDPLSGFFAVRKDKYISGAPLQAIGWKIALELMVKCECKNIEEIPIHFTERHLGHSKMSIKIVLKYLWHLQQLAFFQIFKRVKYTKQGF